MKRIIARVLTAVILGSSAAIAAVVPAQAASLPGPLGQADPVAPSVYYPVPVDCLYRTVMSDLPMRVEGDAVGTTSPLYFSHDWGWHYTGTFRVTECSNGYIQWLHRTMRILGGCAEVRVRFIGQDGNTSGLGPWKRVCATSGWIVIASGQAPNRRYRVETRDVDPQYRIMQNWALGTWKG